MRMRATADDCLIDFMDMTMIDQLACMGVNHNDGENPWSKWLRDPSLPGDHL